MHVYGTFIQDEHTVQFQVLKDKGLVLKYHKLKALVHKSHLPEPVMSYSHGQEVCIHILNARSNLSNWFNC